MNTTQADQWNPTTDVRRFDVLSVGELNVDMLLNSVAGIPKLDKEVLARDAKLVLGSSTAIFASNLSSLGAEVAFYGMVGNDLFGDFIIEKLKEKGG